MTGRRAHRLSKSRQREDACDVVGELLGVFGGDSPDFSESRRVGYAYGNKLVEERKGEIRFM
jgi:hypothetical protein